MRALLVPFSSGLVFLVLLVCGFGGESSLW